MYEVTAEERARVRKTIADADNMGLLGIAESLCEGADRHSEYVRGQVGLICDAVFGLNTDDFEAVTDLLVRPTKPLFQVEFKPTGDGYAILTSTDNGASWDTAWFTTSGSEALAVAAALRMISETLSQ